MVPVDPALINKDAPLPFSLYLHDRTPLACRGQVIQDQGRLAILRYQGWRQLEDGETWPDAPDRIEPPSAPPGAPPITMDPQARVPLTQASVLIADDVPDSRKTTGRLLRILGIQAILDADNGRDVITQFFQRRPHLIFMDIDMPGLDGLTALRQIKSWSPWTFVCLVTGFATLDNIKEAREYNVDAFLAKPINSNGLRKVLALYET